MSSLKRFCETSMAHSMRHSAPYDRWWRLRVSRPWPFGPRASTHLHRASRSSASTKHYTTSMQWPALSHTRYAHRLLGTKEKKTQVLGKMPRSAQVGTSPLNQLQLEIHGKTKDALHEKPKVLAKMTVVRIRYCPWRGRCKNEVSHDPVVFIHIPFQHFGASTDWQHSCFGIEERLEPRHHLAQLRAPAEIYVTQSWPDRCIELSNRHIVTSSHHIVTGLWIFVKDTLLTTREFCRCLTPQVKSKSSHIAQRTWAFAFWISAQINQFDEPVKREASKGNLEKHWWLNGLSDNKCEQWTPLWKLSTTETHTWLGGHGSGNLTHGATGWRSNMIHDQVGQQQETNKPNKKTNTQKSKNIRRRNSKNAKQSWGNKWRRLKKTWCDIVKHETNRIFWNVRDPHQCVHGIWQEMSNPLINCCHATC